jgi:hypothetical protein
MRRQCDFFVLLKVFAEALWQFCRLTVAIRRRPGRPKALARVPKWPEGPKTMTRRILGKEWTRIQMSTWWQSLGSQVRSLVVVAVVVVGVGGLPLVSLLLFQGSMTAGRMEFVFRRLPKQSHFLLAPLLELKRAQFLMMLMFDGAGRSSLGARGRLQGLLARLACLRGASWPLQLLVGLALWRCWLDM